MMSQLTQEQINVDLFDEVKRLRVENEALKREVKEWQVKTRSLQKRIKAMDLELTRERFKYR
jgi:FtsZ-binding cell division protein ZapB